jgi:hypothetical protein
MSRTGWKGLFEGRSFRGQGRYPIRAYSEFMPSVRLGRRAYMEKMDDFFSDDEPMEFPISEFEEVYELRPGLENIAHQVLDIMARLLRGEPTERLARNKLVNNPYWPPELAQRTGKLGHERCVIILPLALSLTQDDKGRKRWTFFGSSEQGPSRPFWKCFFTSRGREIPPERAIVSLSTLVSAAYGEALEKPADLYNVGFRIFAKDGDPDKTLRPSWTGLFIWTSGMSLHRVKYLLSFEPFGNLPETVRQSYFRGEIHLLPFPGSLLFWGVPGYLRMQRELHFANQIPLLHLVERHEGPQGLRVPQSGWMHIPRAKQPLPSDDLGPIRNSFQRTHRWARIHRYEDELGIPGRQDHIAHVLFSTAPDDLDLYGKPMALNSQVWTRDFHLLLDGPEAGQKEIHAAIEAIRQGGSFGYRFQYPPMSVGSHQLYWHRPLVGYLSRDIGKPAVLPETFLGYITAYDAVSPNLDCPLELWPHLCERKAHMAVIELFKDREYEQKTVTRALNLLRAQELLGKSRIPYSFARQILMLPEEKTLDSWLESLPGTAGDREQGRWLAGQLKDLIDERKIASLPVKKKKPPTPLTFGYTARRSFELRYWNHIAEISAGKYRTTDNADCILDAVTQRLLRHHHRDLEALGDYLLSYYEKVIVAYGMQGKALVGDIPFRWQTDFEFDWWVGWLKNREQANERNLMVVIPGRDRGRAVIMADHYDTAYMEDVYYKDRGGSGARLASFGADDNHSATAALMCAAPVFCELSQQGKLGCDIWLVHLTGEEFPSDCLGARHLSQQLIEGTLKLRLPQSEECDLSYAEVQGVYVLDMIGHNSDHDPYKFQISPGTGSEATGLAYQAHIANELWNASTSVWNQRSSRRGRSHGERSLDLNVIPGIALHPKLDGEIRLPRDPKSTLYNTDAQIFSDVGIPVVLFMENYDISRKGYHDSHDTMANIDLDYGSGLAAIAIESVARAATEKPFAE